MRLRAAHILASASIVLVSSALGACGDDTSVGTGGAGGGGGSSGDGGATTGSTSAPATVGSTTTSGATTSGATSSSSSSSSSSSTGTGGGEGGGTEFIPTPESIDFEALGALPAGEQILINDWNAFPNTVASIPPAGGAATPIFQAYRVWSMGVSLDGDTIAFSSGDPLQEEHYGTALGDAIQHTFLYDAASEGATALTWGNINDECHQFSADGEQLYLCRRSDFHTEGDMFLNEGYRVGRVDLGAGAFEFLTPSSEDEFVLSPQPSGDDASMLVQWIDLPNTRSIRRIELASGDVTVLREDAGFPVLSPDGETYLYSDYTDAGSLWSSSEAGGDEVLVVDRQASNARWSPDGTQVVYLVWENALSCSHVEVVRADGSDAGAPTRIRDCGETGEFITDLAWITR